MTNKIHTTPHARQIAIWILRMFSDVVTGSRLVSDGQYADADIALYLGLPVPLKKKDIPGLSQRMMTMLGELEAAGDAALDGTATENFKRFASVFQLSPAETSILTLLGMCETEPALRDSIRVVGDSVRGKSGRFMARVLDLPQAQAEAAMAKSSKLITCGVVRISRHPDFAGRLPGFFSSSVASLLAREPYNPTNLFSAMGLRHAEAPFLGMADYSHLESELSWLVEHLRVAFRDGRTGVNILLYGAPGTGKTQLTRVLGKELALPVFEFSTHDSDGDPLDASDRLVQVRVGARFFAETSGLYVFDEFEDVMRPSPKGPGAINASKSWFNNHLESNRQPVFWLSNSIDHLDPAFARRFDFIIEVPVPPRSCRERMLDTALGELVSGPAIRRLARIESLSPAVVNRVSTVIEGVRSSFPEPMRDDMAVRMIGSVLKAQQRPVEILDGPEILSSGVYDVTLLNVDADLTRMAAMLRANPQARICLHGPPGTGKTALGHWLSQAIDRPIHLKRASDILSPFVGGTEQRLAAVFEDARTDDAILMIDEVDSFLRDRSKAERNWEVTQVNELLTRMESFPGVFIATTNRLEHLDSASLRRFDLKLHFDYLQACQIRDLLCKWCSSLGIPSAGGQAFGMIESMECVTPGDFAAVARRHRFQPFADGTEFLQALMDDCSIKTANQRRIGFL